MLPILLQLGPIKIYSMGVFLVLAIFWGMFLLWKLIKLTAYKEEEMFDGLFIALFGGLFFARAFYVGFNFGDFGFNILKFILINGYPGLSMIGGLLGAAVFFYIFCAALKFDFRELVDYFIPPLFVALAIGSLGSFFSGSGAGTPTSFIIAVSYLGLEGSRHITPIYEAGLYALSAFLSYRALMATRRQQFFKGYTFILFLLLFSGTNVLLDNFKQNHLYFSDLSINFIIPLMVGLVSGFYLLYRFRKNIFAHVKTTYQRATGVSSEDSHQRRKTSAPAD